MASGQDQARNVLRRSAGEIKRYRNWLKLLPAIAGAMTILVVIVYIASMAYNKYGSFTVTVNQFDGAEHLLSLSETPDFMTGTMKLNSKASESITNISKDDLPKDLDSQNGEHSGKNYLAYSFYLKNAGVNTIDCVYELYITNMTMNIESAVRIRLYVNGEYKDYARTRTDGKGPEPDTVEFFNSTVIAKDVIKNFSPNEVTKFTVVIWLEGDDPDCKDDIIGGEFKVDMLMYVDDGSYKNP